MASFLGGDDLNPVNIGGGPRTEETHPAGVGPEACLIRGPGVAGLGPEGSKGCGRPRWGALGRRRVRGQGWAPQLCVPHLASPDFRVQQS